MVARAPRLLMLAALLCLLAPASAAAYEPLSSAEVVDRLNQFRAQSGLPAQITENTEWSRRCKAHNSYMQQNDYIGHPEDPSKPGYSEGGAWAGNNAVLAWGPTWRDGHPWLNAPIHLNQTLAPQLVTVGASEEHERQCLTTFAGYSYERQATGRVLTFPGDGGSMPYSQDVFESPPEPQEMVGLARDAVTGPFLYGYHDDYSVDTILSSGSIEGPDGPVESKTVNAESHELAYLARNSGFLFPVKPLKPGATYRATMTFTQSKDQPTPVSVSHSFSFTATDRALCSNGEGGWYTGCPGDRPGGGDPPPGGELEGVQVKKSYSYRKVKKTGLAVTVPVASPGSVVEVFLTNKKDQLVAKRIRKTIAAAGSYKALPKVYSASAATLLKKTGMATLKVTVIVTPPGGEPSGVVKKLTLTR